MPTWLVAVIGAEYFGVCIWLLAAGKPYQAGVFFAYALGNVFFCLQWLKGET